MLASELNLDFPRQKSLDRGINHVSCHLEMLFLDFQDGAILNLRYVTVINLDCQSHFSIDIDKAVGNYSVCMGMQLQITFPKLNFTQFVNQNVKKLCRRLNSPSLKEVAC